MDIETFVSKSLIGILNGIDKARAGNHASRLPGRMSTVYQNEVRNRHETEPGGPGQKKSEWEMLQMIEFDIAVTVVNSTSVEGGGGIKVMGIGAEGTASTATEKSSVSRIKFSVPANI